MGSINKTKRPSKQRKYVRQAHSFIRHKLISSRLSKDLQKKYKVKKMPVRTGDIVYVASGDFIGTEGKVLSMDYKRQRLSIEGIAREKTDKSKIMYPIHASKVVIRRFGKVDGSRKEILERRAKTKLDIEAEDISEITTEEE